MGGFLGVGESSEQRRQRERAETEKRLALEEAERDRRQREEVALAERKAKKGQDIAKIKVGTEDEESFVSQTKRQAKEPSVGISSSLGIGTKGKKSKTGVQL